ncbi:hypothetical protein B0J13DRAFT_109050 [Dactylonectria estremocensis]|uniref:NmrA-like domain-containing protein n=1 Tax=Dactylonectria estremocensis TaxID=1079267 RepID=A0A9P9JFD4_9HYPO|nr:hypothetical protein B0J13DRAFT_109050 [Dactylonectria estremocensis]
MRSIAVAGGTGPVGKTIVDGLVAYGKHKIFVLSRNDRPSDEGVEYLTVDYTDVKGLSQVFSQAGVDTVVCAIGVATPETNQAQLNLIRAADQSEPTRRFVISGYDMQHLEETIEINPLSRYTFEAIESLEKTDLEYTRVVNGWFLDYYGMPYWKTHLHPWINVINMEKKWAAVPGDGSARATFTTTQDMSKFVARLMDVEKWDKITTISNETLTFNQVVALAEKTRGCKFQVAYDSLEKLRLGKISFFNEFPPIEFENAEAFFAMIHLQAGLERLLVAEEHSLTHEFPEIRLTKMAEVMQAWEGK